MFYNPIIYENTLHCSVFSALNWKKYMNSLCAKVRRTKVDMVCLSPVGYGV